MRAFALLAVLLNGLAAVQAHAHEALVPHNHPHGVSAFAGIDILLALFALPIVAYVIYRSVRGSRS